VRGEEAEKKRKDEKEKLVAALGKWTERTSPARYFRLLLLLRSLCKDPI